MDVSVYVSIFVILGLLNFNAVCKVWFCWREFSDIGISLCGGQANVEIRRNSPGTRIEGEYTSFLNQNFCDLVHVIMLLNYYWITSEQKITLGMFVEVLSFPHTTLMSYGVYKCFDSFKLMIAPCFTVIAVYQLICNYKNVSFVPGSYRTLLLVRPV